jgi:thiamine pyrophosphate-dependent acetolactate synthase large subunit-like protein
MDPRGSIFGRVDFAAIAEGFGLRGANVDDMTKLPALLESFESDDRTDIWNFPMSQDIMSPHMRRLHGK